jgi:phasin family protein
MMPYCNAIKNTNKASQAPRYPLNLRIQFKCCIAIKLNVFCSTLIQPIATEDSMFLMSNQFSSNTLPQFDAQFAAFTAIHQSLAEDFDRYVQLQVETTEQVMESYAAVAQEFFSIKDPQELFALVSSQAQPKYEQLTHYVNCLSALGKHTQTKFNELFLTLSPVQIETTIVESPLFQKIVTQHGIAQEQVKPKRSTTGKSKSTQANLILEAEIKEVKAPIKATAKAPAKASAKSAAKRSAVSR